jgi:hypothetical protein
MFSKKKHTTHATHAHTYDEDHSHHTAHPSHKKDSHTTSIKKSLLRKYIHHLRQQPSEVQQIHAVLFAGFFTLLIGFVVFYRDLGFGTEKYSSTAIIKDAVISEKKIEQNSESPVDFFSSFFSEAKTRLDMIGTGSSSFFESVEQYSSEE